MTDGKSGSDRPDRQINEGLTRRAWLGGATVVVGMGGSALLATSAQAKSSQQAAKYQDHPQGKAQCSACVQFMPPNACKLVEGNISPNGWCTLFTPKAG